MINKRTHIIMMATAAAITLSGCGADDVASPGEGVIVLPAPTPTPSPTPTPTPTPTSVVAAASCPSGTVDRNILTLANNAGQARNCEISGTLTGNTVIQNVPGVVYSLSGAVQVGTDAGPDGSAPATARSTLTIDPGVVLFGSSGGDFLLVNRGSQLFAEGTASSPIIFTSRQNLVGENNANSIGQWGGLVLLGRAPISDCSTGGVSNPTGTRTDCEAIVEGPTNAIYGGNAPGDSSGRLNYVQVRYPGFEVSTGNELNGITVAGVGNGTFFQNIQVHNSSDDGIEWFGGNVNGKNLALTGIDDDSIDSDSGYTGSNQFILAVQATGRGDRLWEADSNGDEDAEPRQDHNISNFTFVAGNDVDVILLRGGGDYGLYNGIMNSANACIDIDGAATVQAAGAAPDENGPPVFESVFLSCGTNFVDDGNISAAMVESIFDAGSNNVKNGVSSLMMQFINGANETAVTPFDVTTINSFFEAVSYIGAVRDANDTRFQGWTCGLYSADPGCADVPTITSA